MPALPPAPLSWSVAEVYRRWAHGISVSLLKRDDEMTFLWPLTSFSQNINLKEKKPKEAGDFSYLHRMD